MQGFDIIYMNGGKCVNIQIHRQVDRLLLLRKQLGSDECNAQTIRIQSNNTHSLQQATEMLRALKLILHKYEKRTTSQKLNDKEVADRRHLIVLFEPDIDTMTEQNSGLQHTDSEAEQEFLHAREEKQRARRQKHRVRSRSKEPGQSTATHDNDSVNNPHTEHEVIFGAKGWMRIV